jgi:predicted PurR-regulated permease PerM
MNESSGRADVSRRIIIGLLVVIAVILVGYTLKIAKFVLMPLFFAFFMVMLIYPVQVWLNRSLPGKLGWFRTVLGLLLVILIVVAALAICVGAIWLSVKMMMDRLPQYSGRFLGYWNRFINWAHERDLLAEQNVLQSNDVRNAMVKVFAAVLRSIWSVTSALIMIFFFVILLLLEVCEWRGKFLVAFGEGYTAAILDTLYTIAYKLRQFLIIRTIISAISGIVAGLWLWIIGVDLAFLWGLMTFIFNYVPYIGSIVSPIPPSLIALAQKGAGWALLALGGLAAFDQVLGNYVDPRLEGRALTISPIFVLMSIVFWGWLWGASGALLAVPITITIIVICSNVKSLKPVATLLSRNKEWCPISHSRDL